MKKHYYHYTVGKHMLAIINSGYIKAEISKSELLKQYLSIGNIKGFEYVLPLPEWPEVTWFSTQPIWENCVNKVMEGVGLEANKHLIPCRLKLDSEKVELHSWKEYAEKYKQNADSMKENQILLKTDPSKHYYVYGPVSLDCIASYEIYIDGKWKAFSIRKIKEVLTQKGIE